MTITLPKEHADPRSAAVHPLDPLSRSELAGVAKVIRTDPRAPAKLRFVSIELLEPSKSALIGRKPGNGIDRRARAVVLDPDAGGCIEAVVSLAAAAAIAWNIRPNVQPAITPDEIAECERVVRRCREFVAALHKRGLDDPELVMVDGWSAGHYGNEPAQDRGRRLVRALTYSRREPHDNGYARPIENVLVVVDLNRMEVVRVEDHGVVPLPSEPANWTSRYVHADRPAPNQLQITQPDGPGFSLQGRAVSWQGWHFRIGFTAREGLVLHTIGYEDGGRLRSIMHRAALSEMVVPYGGPGITSYRKNAFDVGEYGIGVNANSLVRGCDCLGEIRYLDAEMVDAAGNPKTIANAICLHEEDDGILWKHTDWRTGDAEVRRARRLVVSFVATVGIYEYAFYWIFGQDASLELMVKLTGIPSATAEREDEPSRHGVAVAPGLSATLHQHFFNVRLDLDIDGACNTVREVDAVGLPEGEDNPHGNAFVAQARSLETEIAARRRCNQSASRFWQVVNPAVRNRMGQAAGYRLVPGENASLLARRDAAVSRRAGFLQHHLWVTPFSADERFASGEYPNQRADDDGLLKWTESDRPIVDTDLVVWYTFGHTHVPRPEEWPVMPVHKIGFMLKPDGFFERNPALNLPAGDAGDSHPAPDPGPGFSSDPGSASRSCH